MRVPEVANRVRLELVAKLHVDRPTVDLFAILRLSGLRRTARQVDPRDLSPTIKPRQREGGFSCVVAATLVLQGLSSFDHGSPYAMALG